MQPAPPLASGGCGRLRCFSTGSYRWAHNLWILIIYLFFLPVMLPSQVPKLATDSLVTVFPGVWKLLSFLRLPSWDRFPYLPLLPLFLSFIFFPTFFWRQWAAFLGAWYLLPAFRSCFVEFLRVQMFFWSICGAESGLPILFLHRLRTTSMWIFYFSL